MQYDVAMLPPQLLRSKSGFTLIEMSMVLVIIGFIVGGIYLGQSLIRQSQITSITVDVQRYIQAVQDFQQKYNALPGDFANATSYWGARTTCPPANGSGSAGGTLTCNGNSDGQVAWGQPDLFLFWQHLVNAQMIQGNYTGAPGSVSAEDSISGSNVPSTRVDGGGVSVIWEGVWSGNSVYFDNSYGHTFQIGSYDSGTTTSSPFLTGSEAFAIDSKYDDGLPAFGKILTYKQGNVSGLGYTYSPNCATTNVSSTAKYNVSSYGLQCALIFITGF